MSIQIKKLKVAKHLSEETTAFTADVYFNNEMVATVKNDGHGGCNDYRFIKRDVQPTVEKFAADLIKGTKADFGFEQLDSVIDCLISTADIVKKHQSKRLVFQKHITDENIATITPFDKVSIKDALQRGGQSAKDHIKKIVDKYAAQGYACLNTNI